jgi:hypothetical protein
VRAAAPPRHALRAAARGAAAFALAFRLGADAERAAAEVWPSPAAALATGPFAGVEADPLTLWSNPALGAAGPRWSMGASYLEPFGAAGLAREEVAANAHLAGAAISLGAARFGLGDLAAQAWAAGLAGAAARGRVLCGLAVRRHARGERTAWASDLGLCLRPVGPLRVAVVARSAVRAGALEVAPETEWEMDAAWQQGAFSVAAGVSRDAVGPLWSGLATRADVGRLAIYTVLGRLAGGEARVAMGARIRLPGGVRVTAGQEGGPMLPQSRAAALGWSARAAPDSPAARPPAAPRAAPAPDSLPGEELGPPARAGLDSLLGADARNAALDRMLDALGGDLAEDDIAGVEGDPAESAAPAPGVPRIPRMPPHPRAAPPTPRPSTRAPRLLAAGSFTAGWQAWRAAALGASAAGELGVVRRRGWSGVVHAAVTRDPGERAGADEVRASLSLTRAGVGRAIVGAFDAALAGGLLIDAPGPRPAESPGGAGAWRMGPAARAGRAGLPAAWGAALELGTGGPLAMACFWGRAWRDARPIAEGSWPAGGRYHRTDLERSRRSALEERLRGAALEWRSPGGRARLALCAASADYGGAAPRLLPDGSLLARGTWLSACGDATLAGAEIGGIWARGPQGAGAHQMALRRTTGGPEGGTLRLTWARRSEGYAPASALPAPAPRSLVHARWSSRRGPAGVLGWLGLDAEEWASAPTRTARGRHGWSREVLIGAAAHRGPADGSLEFGRGATWREPGTAPRDLGQAAPALVSAPWRATARARWAPPGSELAFDLAHSRRLAAGVWRESWELSCSALLVGEALGRLAVEVRPGAAGAGVSDPHLEADPLGGTYFSYSRTPSRVTADIRFPLGRVPAPRGARSGGPAAIQGRLLARCITSSENSRLELWFTLTTGSPAAP